VTTERPAHLPFNVQGIPPETAARKQWVCWRFKWIEGKGGQPGKWTKTPIDPKTGQLADVTKPANWGTLEQAVAYARRHLSEDGGIGFVFAADDPYTGVDFDHCRNPKTGEIDPAVLHQVKALASYAEPSVSGTGLHVIVNAEHPGGRKREGAFECYSSGRYFTFTGQPLAGFTTIQSRQDELNALHGSIFAAKPTRQARAQASAPASRDLNDILALVLKTRKGEALHRRGDLSGYKSHSEADLALVNLYQMAGADERQADDLMRCSAIFRPEKWDSRRGQSTYGQQTIDRSFDGTVRLWDDQHDSASAEPQPKPQDAESLPDDVAELRIIILDLKKRVEMAERRAEKAEARADMLSQVQSKATGIIRNNKLGQERFTAIALAYRFGNRESAGDKGDDGLYRFKLRDVAREAGISEDTAAAHIAKLAESGVIRKEHRWCPDETYIDKSTGEVRTGVKGQFIGPVGNVTSFIDAVAQLVPDVKKTWGGRADRCPPCPKHPNAGIVKTTIWTCAVCGEELGKDVDGPKPHDAGLVDDDLAATGTDGPNPVKRRLTLTRGLPPRDRNGPTSHNVNAYLLPEEKLAAAKEDHQERTAANGFNTATLGAAFAAMSNAATGPGWDGGEPMPEPETSGASAPQVDEPPLIAPPMPAPASKRAAATIEQARGPAPAFGASPGPDRWTA
jgi:putative DNA primase/helicase